MNATRRMKRARALVVLTVAAVATVSAAVPAGAAGSRPVAPPTKSATAAPLTIDTTEVDPQAAAALAGAKGITVAAATQRLREQKGLGDLGARIESQLAGRSGGSYLDDDGRLVVTTLDGAGDTVVTKSGGRPQRVDDTTTRLNGIMAQLDRLAASSGAGTVQGWYVDVPTNSVVVTVTEGATDAPSAAIVAAATAFGDSVRIERAPAAEAPQATAEYLVGGAEFTTSTNTLCSVGFNTVDSSNRPVVLTAGHCTKTAGTNSRNGYLIGSNRTANFPTDDFGTFWNAYPSFWIPSKSVAKYNGTYLNVIGSWGAPPVGTTICKSGRTTGYTCGTIRAVNQTVNYSTGTVYELVRHDACVEPGDSGGSNLTPTGYAVGLTSGASLSSGKCLSKLGQQNVSYYQPIAEALTRNGLRLAL